MVTSTAGSYSKKNNYGGRSESDGLGPSLQSIGWGLSFGIASAIAFKIFGPSKTAKSTNEDDSGKISITIFAGSHASDLPGSPASAASVAMNSVPYSTSSPGTPKPGTQAQQEKGGRVPCKKLIDLHGHCILARAYGCEKYKKILNTCLKKGYQGDEEREDTLVHVPGDLLFSSYTGCKEKNQEHFCQRNYAKLWDEMTTGENPIKSSHASKIRKSFFSG